MDGARDYNAAREFVDGAIDKGFAAKLAFVDPDRSLTYRDLQIASNKMANVFRGLDIRREARVALLMLDTIDFPVAYWGAIRAGIIPVCLNTLMTADQYRYLIKDCRAEAVVVSSDLLAMLELAMADHSTVRHIIVAGGDGANYPGLAELLSTASNNAKTACTSSDETAFWLYTSGSTGPPKGVRHVHTSLRYVAEHFGSKVLGVGPDDVCFSAAKLFFAYAQGAAMVIPMLAGATSVLLPERPTPKFVMETMRRYHPTVFFGVPTLYATMLCDPSCKLSSASPGLRLCVSAGEALPADVGQSWKKRTGVDILDSVGSTEMLNAFLSNRPDDNKYGTSGRAVDGYKLRLVDEDGNDVAESVIGELLVCGGSAAEGYWNRRKESRKTFVGEWVFTGDKYFRDDEGYYHYCGRTDDMIKVGGRWVSPFEVEQALVSHPCVIEAAVVAKKDAEGLIKPKAFVVQNGQHSAEDIFLTLKEHVKTTIGVWKYPRWIEIVDDLPKTATGKIQRYKLRD